MVTKVQDGAPHTRPGHDSSLALWGGWGALLAGLLFLVLLVYLYGVLAGTGLNADMFDDPPRLLAWVTAHEQQYTGLWWLTLFSGLVLLPAPLALADRLGKGGTSRLATAAGVGGVILGLASPLLLAGASPVLAQGYAGGDPVGREAALLVSRVVGDVGLHLRLGSDLLLGLWLGLSGALMLRRRQVGAGLGLWCLGTAAFALLVVATKPAGLADLEPFLAPVLAVAYLWIGAALLHGRRAD